MSAPHYSDLWQAIARAVPERPAVITREETVTWGRLAVEAAAFARYLAVDRGLRVGDKAATLLYNRSEFLAFLWGCLAVGVAPVAINYRYRASEIRALLVDAGAASFLVPTSLGDVAAEAATGLDVDLVTVDDGGTALSGATDWAQLVAAGGRMPSSAPRGAEMLLYTGGTTGQPKGVVWELDTLLDARRQSTWGIVGVTPPDSLAEAVRIAADPDRPVVVTMPLSPLLHGTAQSSTMATLALGGTVLMHARPRMDIEEAYRLITEHRATRLIVAGDALALPLAEVAEREAGLPSVDTVVSSGMRFSDETKRRLHALGTLQIVDIFASSEGGPYGFGITRSAADLPARIVLTPGAVLLDEDMRELPATEGTLGLVGYRGILPAGYHGDPVKTAETFRQIGGHRYLVPGDWARARGDGSIELLGRLSAVVNTGGEKVFPAEVEEALLAHPTIADAIVFGLPDARFGEAVSAMVVPRPGAAIDTAEVLRFVDARLAGYKKPRHLFVRPSLERTPTGKVELARVKEDAMRELAETAR